MNNDVFDKAHDYAQLISSFQQYKCRNITLSDVVHEILSGMYAKIISDDTVKFEVSSIKSDNMSGWYTDISNILSKNMRSIISKEFSKQTLNGRSLQLIPYTIAKAKPFTSHTIEVNRVYYQKSYKLDLKKDCVVTTEPTQDMAIMSDQQSTSVRHHLKHKLPFTDSVPFKKTLSTSSIIDVAENNNLVVATDNTTQDQSTGYNQIQSNNLSSNDNSSLLGMISDNTGYNYTGYNYPGHNYTENNDTGYNYPGHNDTGYNYTGYNNITGYNYPGHNDTGYNYPGHNDTGYNYPGYNDPGYNYHWIQLSWTQSTLDTIILDTIITGYNHPGYNHPGYNDTGYNYPGYNDTGYNYPGYNDTGYNYPGHNQHWIQSYWIQSSLDSNNPGHNYPGYNHHWIQLDTGYPNHTGYNDPGYNHHWIQSFWIVIRFKVIMMITVY